MKTVFFGSGIYVIPILGVLRDRFGLSLIVTTDTSGAVILFAKEFDIPYLSISKLDERSAQEIKKADADLGIIAYFGTMVPKNALGLFPKGVVNIHPSMLPKYRGSTPVQTAILNGDKETGVTIFQIDEKMDHGPILAQEEFEILDDDNTDTLHKSLFKQGANMLEKTLIDYFEEFITPTAQDDSQSSMTKLLNKKDGFIDINKPPKKETLDRMIRAYYPWPGVWFHADLNGKNTIVKLLPNEMIQTEGKKPQSFKDFANGYPKGKEILSKLDLS